MARNKYPEQTIEKILDAAQQLFMEKGYESTSIEDIIRALDGLSKGAIYHHFKSKEDIFNAVATRYNQPTIELLRELRDDPHLTGFEKLRKMFQLSLSSSDQDLVYTISPNFMENPKLLCAQVSEIFADTAPHYIEPVIRQGMEDGSIVTDTPKALSEVILLLTNLWMNPMVVHSSAAEAEQKARCFGALLKGLGIDLLDETMIQAYVRYAALYQSAH